MFRQERSHWYLLFLQDYRLTLIEPFHSTYKEVSTSMDVIAKYWFPTSTQPNWTLLPMTRCCTEEKNPSAFFSLHLNFSRLIFSFALGFCSKCKTRKKQQHKSCTFVYRFVLSVGAKVAQQLNLQQATTWHLYWKLQGGLNNVNELSARYNLH